MSEKTLVTPNLFERKLQGVPKKGDLGIGNFLQLKCGNKKVVMLNLVWFTDST